MSLVLIKSRISEVNHGSLLCISQTSLTGAMLSKTEVKILLNSDHATFTESALKTLSQFALIKLETKLFALECFKDLIVVY